MIEQQIHNHFSWAVWFAKVIEPALTALAVGLVGGGAWIHHRKRKGSRKK